MASQIDPTKPATGLATTASVRQNFLYARDEIDLKANTASPIFTGVPAAPTAAASTNTTQLATTAFVTTADNLKSNLASPTFTGVPAAPTAAASTNTTQLATTAFVTTADNLKSNIDSPTFTGVPAAPTAAIGTNTTQLATAAYVRASQPNNASVATATGFATDTYLVGSSLVVPAGIWLAKTVYRCLFDIVKTAAGTAAFTVNVRLGTAGSTADASVCSLAFAVGTAVADTGQFEVVATFRTVGSGTTAVVQGQITCSHHLAATGLITTGASGFGLINTTGAGFNSTTQTTIGISVNGGASFAGTNTQVLATLDGI